MKRGDVLNGNSHIALQPRFAFFQLHWPQSHFVVLLSACFSFVRLHHGVVDNSRKLAMFRLANVSLLVL